MPNALLILSTRNFSIICLVRWVGAKCLGAFSKSAALDSTLFRTGTILLSRMAAVHSRVRISKATGSIFANLILRTIIKWGKKDGLPLG